MLIFSKSHLNINSRCDLKIHNYVIKHHQWSILISMVIWIYESWKISFVLRNHVYDKKISHIMPRWNWVGFSLGFLWLWSNLLKTQPNQVTLWHQIPSGLGEIAIPRLIFYCLKWSCWVSHLLILLLCHDLMPSTQLIVGLQTNTSVASALGTYFLSQISLIFLDMLNVYRCAFHCFL